MSVSCEAGGGRASEAEAAHETQWWSRQPVRPREGHSAQNRYDPRTHGEQPHDPPFPSLGLFKLKALTDRGERDESGALHF